MFTGLIAGLGEVVESTSSKLVVKTPWKALAYGESISVEGVCLTVERRKAGRVQFEVGPETRRITTLGHLKAGDTVNLERALRVGDRLGGHWVTGHVEGIGHIRAIRRERNAWWLTIQIPKTLRKFAMAKGSITIDGISLTVAALRGDQVSIMIIPHTWTHTTLQQKKPGSPVNLEMDLFAKYVLRQHS